MAVLVHNGYKTDYYAGMGTSGVAIGTLKRTVDFLGQRGADFFKFVGITTSIAVETMTLTKAEVKWLSMTGRTCTSVIAAGIDVLSLPSAIDKLVKKRSLFNIGCTVSGTAKLLKLGKNIKVWSLGDMEAPISVAQNIAGIIVCGKSALKDYAALSKRRERDERIPLYERKALVYIKFAKYVSLAKNTSRVSLSVLALAGTVVASTTLLTLATIGVGGSILSFFLKQNAEIIRAVAHKQAQKEFKMNLSKLQEENATPNERTEAALNIIQAKGFKDNLQAQRALGAFLGTLEANYTETIIGVIEGLNEVEEEIRFGSIAMRQGLFFEERIVKEAIVAGLQNYKNDLPQAG